MRYKYYIAGPMSGYMGFNFESFNIAERVLSLLHSGDVCYNPATKGIVKGWTWSDYLRDSLKEMLDCEKIALLNGWEASAGANVELYLATILGMPKCTLNLETLELNEDDCATIDVAPEFKHIPVVDPTCVCNGKSDTMMIKLALLCGQTIQSIMSTNSENHGGHVEWQCRTPQMHLQKSARHALSAMSQLDRHDKYIDNKGETPIDHVERVLVRAVMALSVLKEVDCAQAR